jgi:cytochrome c oxidase assembly factor CtaG
VLLFASSAWYHPLALTSAAWTWDPLPLLTLLPALVVYFLGVARLWAAAGRGHGISAGRAACFGIGIAVALLALVSPLDRLSDSLFAAHMSQHELLMVVVAPLIVLGRPFTGYVWALPLRQRVRVARWVRRPATRGAWQFISAPLFALVLHAVTRWVWHLPWLFEAAMKHDRLHAFQHLTFFSTAALLWWAMIHGRYGKAGYGLSVLFVFATALHTSILGVLIGVAPRVIYQLYQGRTAVYGWQPLDDQALAGIIMWVPSGLLFMICGLALFAVWLGEAERRANHAAAASETRGHPS